MKKFKKILIVVAAFFMFALNIYATPVTINMSGPNSIDAGKSFSITVSATGNNVWGITMGLNYDSSKLELVSNEAKSGFTATVGKNIVLDSISGKNGTFEVIVLNFKPTSNFVAGQSTTITLNNVKGSSDSSVTNGTGASKTISVNIPKSSNNNLSSLKVDGTLVKNFNMNTTTYDLGTVQAEKNSIVIDSVAADSKSTITGNGAKALNYGPNTFNVIVKAENGATKTYQIKINRVDPRSKNNDLSSLSISPLSISFNKSTTSYTVIAEHNVTSIDIKATVSDPKAAVTGTGTKTLKDYVNVFKVTVKAENQTTKTYTITVNRKDSEGVLGNVSKDNTLKSLSIEGYTINFDKNTTEYNIEVDSQVTNLKINAVANHVKAQVKIENYEKLVIGNNKVNVIVTAESGSKKTYTINVLRKNNIPVTTIQKLNETIDKIENDKLIVEIKDEDNILTKENISKIKASKKEVTITKYNDNNKILYSFEVNGNKLDTVQDLNTEIKFTSQNEDKIDQLTNYSDSIYLDFSTNDNFSNGIKIKVNVSDKYKDNQLVNIYQYNETTNQMEEIQTSVQVSNGYVELTIKNPKDTIITRATLGTSVMGSLGNIGKINIFMIIAIIEGVVILGLILMLAKKKNNKPSFEQEYNYVHQNQNINHTTPTFVEQQPKVEEPVQKVVNEQPVIDTPEIEEVVNPYEEQLKAQQASINNMNQNS